MKERELDLVVSDHAAHWLLCPVTDKGQAWCKRELGEDVHIWRGSYVIPNPLIFSVLQAIVDDRLELDYRSGEL